MTPWHQTPAKHIPSRSSSKTYPIKTSQDISVHTEGHFIAKVVDKVGRIFRISHTEISISQSTINSHLNVMQVRGIAMEAKLMKNSPDPVNAVLRRTSTLNRQLNRLKKNLDSLGTDSIVDFADCHSDEERVTRVRMDVGLDAVGPLEVRVEVASNHWVWRRSVSHVVGVPAVVLEIPDEDGPVVCREAEASSVVAERQLAAVVECQEQLVAVGRWGVWTDPAIGWGIADLYVYTLVNHSS